MTLDGFADWIDKRVTGCAQVGAEKSQDDTPIIAEVMAEELVKNDAEPGPSRSAVTTRTTGQVTMRAATLATSQQVATSVSDRGELTLPSVGGPFDWSDQPKQEDPKVNDSQLEAAINRAVDRMVKKIFS